MPTYRIDLHSHCQGDPVDDLEHTIHEHIDHAHACGLHAIALTWHQRIFDDTAAIAYARERGILLIPGVETELHGRLHTLALNAHAGDIPGTCTLEDLRIFRQNPNHFVLAPHPYYPHWSCLRTVIDEHPDCFDGVEWCHYHTDWIPRGLNPNERARRWAERNHKPLIACSDAHDLRGLGRFYSEVEAEELSAAAIFAALRANRVRFTPQPMTTSYFLLKSGKIVTSIARRILSSR